MALPHPAASHLLLVDLLSADLSEEPQQPRVLLMMAHLPAYLLKEFLWLEMRLKTFHLCADCLLSYPSF
jgi:hypothetical protein